MIRPAFAFVAMTAVLLLAHPQTAAAYIGPGAGVSVLGSILALIAAILLAVVGFVWYPVKRLLTKGKKVQKVDNEPSPS